MDPTAVISHLWTIGPSAALLGLAVWYFYNRDKRNDAAAESRYAQCEARNAKLDERMQALERRQFDQLNNLTERGIAGLADATAAIKRFIRDDSDTPRDSFPAHKDTRP